MSESDAFACWSGVLVCLRPILKRKRVEQMQLIVGKEIRCFDFE